MYFLVCILVISVVIIRKPKKTLIEVAAMTTSNEAVKKAVQNLSDAMYFLDQEALKSRDLWMDAKQRSDEEAIRIHRKFKVKVHTLKKSAVMDLISQGHATIKGFYKCVAVESEPHLLAVDIAGREFLVPISHKISKNLPCLGEQSLVSVDTEFQSNLTISSAIILVRTYLNPNYEEEIAQFKKAFKDKKPKMGKKPLNKNGAKPQNKGAGKSYTKKPTATDQKAVA